jgi:hypothetical protein
VRLTVLLLALICCLHSVEVPAPFQVIFDDLQWVDVQRGSLVWRQGGYDDLHPVRAGNIQGSTILWLKRMHTVTAFTRISDRKAIIESDLGTFTLKQWKNRLWLIDLKPAIGPIQTMRTSGAQWPDSMRLVDWDPETEAKSGK